MAMAERFVQLRQHLGLSTRELSARIGVSKSLWSHYECGTREPGMSMLRELSCMGINLEWLVNGNGPMTRDGLHIPSIESSGTLRTGTLARLIRSLEDILYSNRGQQLQVWARIIRFMEKNEFAASRAELEQLLTDTINAARLDIELQNLVSEGLIAESKGQFRLIHTALQNRSEGLELWMILAVRELLHKHLPIQKQSPHRGKLEYCSVTVKSGSGPAKARELGLLFVQWLTSIQSAEAQPTGDGIDVILSVVVTQSGETNRAINREFQR